MGWRRGLGTAGETARRGHRGWGSGAPVGVGYLASPVGAWELGFVFPIWLLVSWAIRM
jgi:hypothetical protein